MSIWHSCTHPSHAEEVGYNFMGWVKVTAHHIKLGTVLLTQWVDLDLGSGGREGEGGKHRSAVHDDVTTRFACIFGNL